MASVSTRDFSAGRPTRTSVPPKSPPPSPRTPQKAMSVPAINRSSPPSLSRSPRSFKKTSNWERMLQQKLGVTSQDARAILQISKHELGLDPEMSSPASTKKKVFKMAKQVSADFGYNNVSRRSYKKSSNWERKLEEEFDVSNEDARAILQIAKHELGMDPEMKSPASEKKKIFKMCRRVSADVFGIDPPPLAQDSNEEGDSLNNTNSSRSSKRVEDFDVREPDSKPVIKDSESKDDRDENLQEDDDDDYYNSASSDGDSGSSDDSGESQDDDDDDDDGDQIAMYQYERMGRDEPSLESTEQMTETEGSERIINEQEYYDWSNVNAPVELHESTEKFPEDEEAPAAAKKKSSKKSKKSKTETKVTDNTAAGKELSKKDAIIVGLESKVVTLESKVDAMEAKLDKILNLLSARQ